MRKEKRKKIAELREAAKAPKEPKEDYSTWSEEDLEWLVDEFCPAQDTGLSKSQIEKFIYLLGEKYPGTVEFNLEPLKNLLTELPD